MRYFFVHETGEKEEGRRFFAAGVIAFAASLVLDSVIPRFGAYLYVLDLFGCLLCLGGCILFDRHSQKTAIVLFALAFLARMIIRILHPVGLFSFLALLPFSALVLAGEISMLLKMRLAYDGKLADSFSQKLKKATNALCRAEVSYWMAALIAYVSDLLILPATLMLFWSIGVRIWVSFLLFQSPCFARPDPLKSKP